VETFIAGANFPVALAFAPDGRLFYNELLTGQVRIVQNGQLQAQPFVTVPVATNGEQGLLGLALDSNFANNRFVYIYHTHPNPLRNRVVRYTESNGVATNETVIADNLPVNTNHNGGRVAFGPDGRVYVTIGDAGDPANSQSSTSLAGKVLSYDPSGTQPAARLVALGLRNCFGIAFHRVSAVPYVSDNGPNCDDEINRIIPLGNYGWRPNYPCGDANPQFIAPIRRFTPTIAPTGIAFYAGNVFPEWRNHLFLADFNDGRLRRFVVNELDFGRVMEEQVIINGGFGALLDVTVGTDGNLYVASDTAVLRIVRGP
jgi:glucose/arabinose dehydrogenase